MKIALVVVLLPTPATGYLDCNHALETKDIREGGCILPKHNLTVQECEATEDK